jgi:hypothetical protein
MARSVPKARMMPSSPKFGWMRSTFEEPFSTMDHFTELPSWSTPPYLPSSPTYPEARAVSPASVVAEEVPIILVFMYLWCAQAPTASTARVFARFTKAL